MADLKHYERYGWQCSEKNLATLPEDAPQAAKDLAKWLTLEGRRSSLEEWLGCFSEDTGRIHGSFWAIGAWTHRMAHSNPNSANIPAPYNHPYEKIDDSGFFYVNHDGVEFGPMPYDKALRCTDGVVSPVEQVKAKYDAAMRGCFTVPEGSYLVGCDAAGIQLRILAHLMKSKRYVEAIVNGRKEDETDIHNLNRKALGKSCRNRDVAKTFIYAWLLGAGVAKIAQILNCSMADAKKAIDNFLTALPELKRIKEVMIPRDAARGYFIGIDGRKVPQTSQHLMLAGYLQNMESIIMKKAALKWTEQAVSEGIKFKLVNYVHDEYQVEVNSGYDDAVRLGELMVQSFKDVGEELDLFCPLDGEYRIGSNWTQTH